MTDDDDLADDLADLDDEDEDGGDLGTGQGHAAVLHWVESLGARFDFTDSVDDAVRLAAQQPCPIAGCLGGHSVLARDARGHLRTIASTDGDDQVVDRLNHLLRMRERRRELRKRLADAERMRQRRARNLAALEEREDPDDGLE
ncbi:hypothetical protein B8W69_26975 [Mycobacterium vulneris]|uniref:Uncharacterized protein n=1 Tax=Mycolicibacterium vulneris TaxID=547163 RepID=A0A1X2KJZ1_9MYCO|nr:hypothetical protein [Mycolicibacterium vulneris]OSC22099.1 hypothetical protein B8W69_26975 [Mycolicibacterium vulneris]